MDTATTTLSDAETTAEGDAAVEHRKMETLAAALERSLVASTLSIVVFSAMLVATAPRALAVWIAVRFAVSATSFAWLRHARRNERSPASLRRPLIVMMIAGGIVWGSVPLIVAGEAIQWWAVAGLWIFGNQAVITTMCAPDREVFVAAITPVTIVGATTIAIQGEGFAFIVAAIVVLGGVYAVAMFSTTHSTVNASIRAELAAGRLSAELLERTAELERANAELDELANLDQLTGLMNRRAVVAHLTDENGRTTRDLWIGLADLDRFKSVNDTFGHGMGDEVLRQVAMRWRAALADADAAVGRLGGDEFIVAVPTECAWSPEQLSATMTASLERPVSWGQHRVVVDASVGFADVAAGTELSTALASADQALYAEKRTRRTAAPDGISDGVSHA